MFPFAMYLCSDENSIIIQVGTFLVHLKLILSINDFASLWPSQGKKNPVTMTFGSLLLVGAWCTITNTEVTPDFVTKSTLGS